MSGYNAGMTLSSRPEDAHADRDSLSIRRDRSARVRALNEQGDLPRAWVKIDIGLPTGVFGRAPSMSEERVFVGDELAEPYLDVIQRASAEQAIRGLREMADILERRLRETYLP